MSQTILVLNGPNLNMLGVRQPEIYGANTYADVVSVCESAAAARGVGVDVRQTNSEAEMVGWLHQAAGSADVAAIVINPAGWTHTSVALADALVIPDLPIVEVHLTNVHAREEFRRHSYVSPIAVAVIAGCGIAGYRYAVDYAAELIG